MQQLGDCQVSFMPTHLQSGFTGTRKTLVLWDAVLIAVKYFDIINIKKIYASPMIVCFQKLLLIGYCSIYRLTYLSLSILVIKMYGY